jgi:hypothetical protein
MVVEAFLAVLRTHRNSDRFEQTAAIVRRDAHAARAPLGESAGQPSTLYFVNQACIWFQPSSAASLR